MTTDAAPLSPAGLPRELRSDADLDVQQVADLLTGPQRDALLARLGITGEDAEQLAPLADAAAADPEILAEVARTANLLRAGAGLDVPAVDLEGMRAAHEELAHRLAPGEGLIPILALVAATDTVRAWHAARDLTTEQSWHVLADLGQQMRVHRRGTALLGLHQLNWVSGNWAGRLVHLGRLQFDLHREEIAKLDGAAAPDAAADAPRRWVIGTHIPATGPLDPAEVDASFAAATAYFSAHYPDLVADPERGEGAPDFGHELTCHSWLLSDAFEEITGPDSNLARFARRWTRYQELPGDGDSALFFCFGLRPPQDLAALPRRTRLERGVAERLEDGRGWTSGVGRLLR